MKKIKFLQKSYQIMYLIQMGDTNYYKIGITDNINRRWYQLQCGNPLPLKVLAMWGHTQRKIIQKYELNLHRILTKQGQRVRANGEWFNLTQEQVNIISSVAGNTQEQNKLLEKILKNQKI